MSTATLAREGRRGRTWFFLLHLLEMTVAMMVGMLVFGSLVGVIAGAAGSSLEAIRVGQPELFVLGMAAGMSVTMVAWMRRRGHSHRSCREMTAAMFVPAFGLIAGYRLGAVSADAVCPVACALMIPAMAGAMLFRIDAYTTHEHGEPTTRGDGPR
jgi:flagellar biosynthetic protein FliP